MNFINQGGPVKIRIGKISEDFSWKTIKEGEIIELSRAQGRSLEFQKLKTTVGQIGNQVVQTKQVEVEYTPDDLFFKELKAINGIGKKTAMDIVEWGTKEKLIETIKQNKSLPFRDDVEDKLRRTYG